MRRILCLSVFLVVAVGMIHAQPPAPAAKGERFLYLVRYGVAKDLGATLTQHFGTESGIQFVAEPNANALLINAPTAQSAELMKLLDQLDRRPRQILVDVMLVDVTLDEKAEAIDPKDFTGAPDAVFAKAEGLTKKGKGGQTRRFRIAGLENQRATTMIGSSQPYATGTAPNRGGGFGGAGGGPGGVSTSVSYRDLGTMLTVTPRGAVDGPITLDMQLDDSRMQASEGAPMIGPDLKATEFIKTTMSGKVQLTPGEAILAEGVRTTAKDQKVQTLVIVSAKFAEK